MNRLQFEFNSEDEDSLKQKLWALEYEKREYTIELHNDSFDKLKPRNKHSRIADSAEGGLETAPRWLVILKTSPIVTGPISCSKEEKGSTEDLTQYSGFSYLQLY